MAQDDIIIDNSPIDDEPLSPEEIAAAAGESDGFDKSLIRVVDGEVYVVENDDLLSFDQLTADEVATIAEAFGDDPKTTATALAAAILALVESGDFVPHEDETSPAPEVEEQVVPAETITISKDQLAEAIQAEVAKALAAQAKTHNIVVKPQGAKSKRFVRVSVHGTYVESINKNVSNNVNFTEEVNMPSDYTMGDLRRSLPNRLARLFPSFKRLRSVDAHRVIGPATIEKETGKVRSDYVLPTNRVQRIAADHINKAEGVEENSDIDTTEYGPDGLPDIINK